MFKRNLALFVVVCALFSASNVFAEAPGVRFLNNHLIELQTLINSYFQKNAELQKQLLSSPELGDDPEGGNPEVQKLTYDNNNLRQNIITNLEAIPALINQLSGQQEVEALRQTYNKILLNASFKRVIKNYEVEPLIDRDFLRKNFFIELNNDATAEKYLQELVEINNNLAKNVGKPVYKSVPRTRNKMEKSVFLIYLINRQQFQPNMDLSHLQTTFDQFKQDPTQWLNFLPNSPYERSITSEGVFVYAKTCASLFDSTL